MRPRSISDETIKAMRAETMTYKEIAEKYGIGLSLTTAIMLNTVYHSALYRPKARKAHYRRASLRDGEILDIRRSSLTAAELADKHGVSISVIGQVRGNYAYHSPTYNCRDRRRKLTDSQIKKIVTSNKTQMELSKIFGVSQPAISHYRRKFAAQTA